MPASLSDNIVALFRRPSAPALKPKALARKLNLPAADYNELKETLRALLRSGELELDGA